MRRLHVTAVLLGTALAATGCTSSTTAAISTPPSSPTTTAAAPLTPACASLPDARTAAVESGDVLVKAAALADTTTTTDTATIVNAAQGLLSADQALCSLETRQRQPNRSTACAEAQDAIRAADQKTQIEQDADAAPYTDPDQVQAFKDALQQFWNDFDGAAITLQVGYCDHL